MFATSKIRLYNSCMARTLTKKERGFVRDYVKTGNGTRAALKNYDTKEYFTAAAIASENLKKPQIINAIKSIADSIPDELLQKVHIEGLKASDKIGDIEIPDYGVRHKYLDSAYKLKGAYAAEKTIGLTINVPIENLEKGREAINDYLNGINQKNS